MKNTSSNVSSFHLLILLFVLENKRSVKLESFSPSWLVRSERIRSDLSLSLSLPITGCCLFLCFRRHQQRWHFPLVFKLSNATRGQNKKRLEAAQFKKNKLYSYLDIKRTETRLCQNKRVTNWSQGRRGENTESKQKASELQKGSEFPPQLVQESSVEVWRTISPNSVALRRG